MIFPVITLYQYNQIQALTEFFCMNFLLLLYATVVKLNQIKNIMNREDLCNKNTFLEMLCEVDVCDVEALVFSSGQNSKLLLPLKSTCYFIIILWKQCIEGLYTQAQLHYHIQGLILLIEMYRGWLLLLFPYVAVIKSQTSR